MSAELLGMFFVAEDVFGGDNTGRPLELTCYRRNLWQCSGQIILPRQVSHIIDEQGQQLPVFELAASISAIESIEGRPTEIISIPWKSSAGEETKSPSAPPNVPLDLSTGQELDHNRISLPVSWKRLQFKHATANNGRRKGLQQHYVVQINLLSKRENGEFVKIAEIRSGPVIVRGRSPRNFDSRRDVPLSGDKKAERRATVTSTEAATPVPKTEKGTDLAQTLPKYHSVGNVQVRLTLHKFYLVSTSTWELLLTLAESSNPVNGHHHHRMANKVLIPPRKLQYHPISTARPYLHGHLNHQCPSIAALAQLLQHHVVILINARRPQPCPSTCPSPRTSVVPTAPTPILYRLISQRVKCWPRTSSRVPRMMRKSFTSTSR